jgi:hypothetical protein
MQPNVIDYASKTTPRRRIDWLRLGPFFATVCAAFAWLKSAQYQGRGQLADEQVAALLFVILSIPCLIVTFTRFPRYRTDGRRKQITMIILCLLVISCDLLAVWNLSIAMIGAKDRLF